MNRGKIIAFIKEKKNELSWYHTIDLGDGITTPGMYDHRHYLQYYGLPEDLSGKRVLDIGTANGFFAFEMEERGADEVIGIDIAPPETFNFCKKIRGSKARFVRMSIDDLHPDKLGGQFDLVFCGSLLLHLDDIVGAMRRIRSMTKDTAIVASAYFDAVGEDWPLFFSYLRTDAVRGLKGRSKEIEITFPVTWYGNRKAYKRLFEYVGFEHTKVISTFMLEVADTHDTDVGSRHKGVPHIVVRGKVKATMKMRNARREAGVAEKLAEIRKEVIGSCLPPKDMDVFSSEESGERKKTKEMDMENDFIGITVQYPITSHRRIVGGIIVFAKKVVRRLLRWLIIPVIDQINAVLNAHQTYFESNEQILKEVKSRFEEGEKRFEETQQRLNAYQTHLESNEQILKEVKSRSEEGYHRLSELFEYLSERVDTSLEKPMKEVRQLDEKLKLLEEIKISQRLNRFERLIKRLKRPMARLEEKPLEDKEGLGKEQISEGNLPSMDYFLFEEKFRGDEELISKRQSRYLELFLKCERVLDIGCGRGEFLEALRKNNVKAYGLELNEDMIHLCKEKDLEVYWEDALTHLDRISPNSLGGIFSSQVVEHLGSKELLKLIELSFDRLNEGGIFVANTLNPSSLSALEFFYMDPSHIRPVHSKTFEFLLESTGFSDIRIEFNNGEEKKLGLKELPIEPGYNRWQKNQIELSNRNVRILNQMLFSPIEYTIIAKKPQVADVKPRL